MSSDDGQSDGATRRRTGTRLKEARMYLGLSQDEVAGYLKIDAERLFAIENGRESPSTTEIYRLARFYRQSVDHLTGDQDTNSNLPPDIAHLARQSATVTDTDRGELARFVDYLTARKAMEGGDNGE